MIRGIITLGIVVLLALAFAFGFYRNGSITGQTIDIEENNTYSWTKAVCDEGSCIDIKITCDGDRVVDLQLSSDLKEFSPNWIDPRSNLEKEKLCVN